MTGAVGGGMKGTGIGTCGCPVEVTVAGLSWCDRGCQCGHLVLSDERDWCLLSSRRLYLSKSVRRDSTDDRRLSKLFTADVNSSSFWRISR